MDIRSSLDTLKSLLRSSASAPAAAQQTKSGATVAGSGLGTDKATFSSAGSEVSQTATDAGIRMDKVADVQAALASGSYNVSAGAVASKVVDSMLGGKS